MKQIMLVIAAFSLLGSTRVEAKVLTLSPVQYGAGTAADVPGVQTATVPQTGDEVTVSEAPLAEAFLKFDLTPVEEGGRPINMVVLEWPVEGVFSDSVTTYSIYAVPDSATIPVGGEPPATREDDLLGAWNLAPIDIVRSGGATVLFDLTDLVKDWVSGAKSNKGIVVKTRALSEDDLRMQLTKARLVAR